MFIVWGTKIKTYNMGLVADYCPICREPGAFQIREYCEARHLYFISLTRGNPFKYTAICQQCGVEKAPSTGLTTQAIKPKEPMALDELIRHTFPNLEQKKRKIVERNERLKADPSLFSVEERIKLVQEPFVVMDTAISDKQEKSSHQKVHPATLLGGIAALAFVFPGFVFFIKWSERGASSHLTYAILFFVAAILAGVIAAFGSRMGRQELYYPILTKAYAPLKPTRDELRTGFKTSPSKIATKINPDHLFDHLQVQSRLHRR